MEPTREQSYQRRIAELEARVALWKTRAARAEAEVAELKTQVARLAEQVAKLSRNSSQTDRFYPARSLSRRRSTGRS